MFEFLKRNKTPVKRSTGGSAVVGISDWDMVRRKGYTRLSESPEVVAAVQTIANMVSVMPIHLMENTKNGNRRIENALSKKVDCNPNEYMTRSTLISAIVRTLLLEGDGNAVLYPETKDGRITNLYLLDPSRITFIEDGFRYWICYNGKKYDPRELCHIVINPLPDKPWMGSGYKVSLQRIVDGLEAANSTKKAFMESKYAPSLIVTMDGFAEDLIIDEEDNESQQRAQDAAESAKQKLLRKFVTSEEKGVPWLLPEGFHIEQIKPLSLNDLALNPSIKLDKTTVANILQVPPFLLGIGSFDQKEWNNFINTRIRFITEAIQQALTKSLLLSDDWFFKFNYRSLYAYDIQTLSTVAKESRAGGIIDGNEARSMLGLSPREGLDELITLENYIPTEKLGDQKKLKDSKSSDAGGEENG